MSRLTMRELARTLGVSPTTVSKALADHPDISPATRARIRKAADDADYLPDHYARALRTRRTRTLGVVITDNANPYFAGVIRGIEEVTRARGYHLLLANTGECNETEVDVMRLLLGTRAAGLLITPAQKETTAVGVALRSGTPIVLINRRFDELDTNYVIGDDHTGAFQATRYLLEKGHHRIACIAGPMRISPARERLRGYQDAMTANGVAVDPRAVVDGCANPDDGCGAAKALLAWEPSAILCFSDYVALGAMEAVLASGRGIPDDVALVGYDNIEFAPYLKVPLTTVDNPRFAIGQTAADLLLDIIDGRRPPEGHHVILPPSLVVRASA